MLGIRQMISIFQTESRRTKLRLRARATLRAGSNEIGAAKGGRLDSRCTQLVKTLALPPEHDVLRVEAHIAIDNGLRVLISPKFGV